MLLRLVACFPCSRPSPPPPVLSRKVPLCVDVSKETFQSLIELVLQHEPVFLQQSPEASSQAASSSTSAVVGSKIAGQEGGETAVVGVGGSDGGVGELELDAAVALSAVNILTNQMFQLIRGSTSAVVREVIDSRRRRVTWSSCDVLSSLCKQNGKSHTSLQPVGNFRLRGCVKVRVTTVAKKNHDRLEVSSC